MRLLLPGGSRDGSGGNPRPVPRGNLDLSRAGNSGTGNSGNSGDISLNLGDWGQQLGSQQLGSGPKGTSSGLRVCEFTGSRVTELLF